MSQNNSSTEFEKSTSEDFPVMLLHFASGDVMIGEVVGFNAHLIVVRTPLDVHITYDEENNSPESFNLQPYLQPFSSFTQTTQINFNINQLISVVKPHDMMTQAYKNAIEKMFSESDETQEVLGDEIPDPPKKILYH